MKRLSLAIAFLCVFVMSGFGQKAKYVFYFIGDGMGVNQVNATEMYLGALEGRIGITELCFPSFPYVALSTTYSGSSGVTDSAAAGTALSTGSKTSNGTLGMLADHKTDVTSVAKWAHDAGAAVGVTTSVSVDHATPAAFYAHVKNRSQMYEIGQQLTKTDYDFFGGSDFAKPKNPVEGGPDLYEQAKNAGYTIVRGYKNYQKAAKKADKMILFQPGKGSMNDQGSIPYAIDRDKTDLTLPDITRAATNFLTKKQGEKNGFFLMVEGGKIDYAGHANDLATVIRETMDMDDAVKVAYEFYQQHPDETLIVVTADHETGGIALGSKVYELALDRLRYQTMSVAKLGNELKKLHKKHGDNYNYDVVKEFLKQNFSFGDKIKLNESQEKRLKEAFDNVEAGKGKDSESLYQKDDELASTVRIIMQEQALVSWPIGTHSAGYTPVFAIGAGAELFSGRIDNTDIPKRIAQAAGWTVPEF